MNRKLIVVLSTIFLVIILSFALYFVQNNYFSSSSADKTVALSNVDQGLQLSVTLQANKTRFAQGEVVNMTFTLTNISNQTVNVINLNNFSFFNFYIYDNRNNLVGARNIGAAGIQNITIHLAPKENYAENIQWRQGGFWDTNPPQLPIGLYHLNGFVDDNATYNLRTEPLNITITHR